MVRTSDTISLMTVDDCIVSLFSALILVFVLQSHKRRPLSLVNTCSVIRDRGTQCSHIVLNCSEKNMLLILLLSVCLSFSE
jgi:hypothetical protein